MRSLCFFVKRLPQKKDEEKRVRAYCVTKKRIHGSDNSELLLRIMNQYCVLCTSEKKGPDFVARS